MRLMINCLLAATIFWWVNAMQKEYNQFFNLPVHVEYNKKKVKPEQPLPSHLRIELRASGWNLLQKSFGIGIDTVVLKPRTNKKSPITIEDLMKWNEEGITDAQLSRLDGDSLYLKWVSLR